jgi:hypothetical protein
MGRIGRWRARWSGLSRPRRLGAIAAVAVAAGVVGVAVEAGSGDGIPAPIVWQDHVLDPTTTTTG